MSKKWLLALLAVTSVAAIVGSSNLASALKDEAKAAPMMKAQYLLLSPHTKEECLAALDATAAKGTDALKMWQWGCMAGDHTGYAFISADSDAEALMAVPEVVRAKARAVKLTLFAAEQIKSFHDMHQH